jgi:transglutaminase-like putative cysteine protease
LTVFLEKINEIGRGISHDFLAA